MWNVGRQAMGTVLFVVGLALSGPLQAGDDAAKGKNLFVLNCAPCHQADGEGKPGFAPSIRNRDFLAIANDEFIEQTVVKGRAGTAMVARPDLAGESVELITAYLRSLPVENPIKVKVNRRKKLAGDPVKGKGYYAQYCGSCHGAKGEGYMSGGPGPGIGLAGFLDVASDDYIFQTVKLGRMGTAMKSFLGAEGVAALDEQQVFDIIGYLRKLGSGEAEEDVVAATTVVAGDAEKGKGLFQLNCAPCHQPDAGGKVGFAPSLNNRDFLAMASDTFIKQTISKGRVGTAMVARPDINDEALNHLIAFLRSAKVAVPVKIPVDNTLVISGDVKHGAKTYGIYCANCHGANGEGYAAGGAGPGIGMAGFLAVASDDFIYQTMKYGRSGTAMRSFLGSKGLANLTPKDARDVVAFLRAKQK